MGIKFACPSCKKPLNVKDSFAGKRGFCPECKGRINIPPISGRGSEPPQSDSNTGVSASPTSSVSVSMEGAFTAADAVPMASTVDTPSAPPVAKSYEAIDESPDSVWYVRPKVGGQFGPASGELMRRWLVEGRVSHDALVWRDGWADWLEAARVFPQLNPALSESEPDGSGQPQFGISRSFSKSTAYNQHRRSQKNRLTALLIIGSIVAGILVIVLLLVI